MASSNWSGSGVGEALVDDGVLGVAAVGVPARERRRRGTGSRRRAGRTGTGRMSDAARRCRRARRPRYRRGRRAGGVDDADDLVAGHDVGAVGGQIALGEMEVGAADAADRDPHPDLTDSRNRGLAFDQRQWARRRSGPGRAPPTPSRPGPATLERSRTGWHGARRDHDHGALGVVRDLVADRTQQQAGQRPMAARPDDDHRRRRAGLDQAAPGKSLREPWLDRRGQAAEVRLRPVHVRAAGPRSRAARRPP